MGISLTQVWDVFSASDSRFAELARYLRGARVLRQDPVECLVQFLCSSNNNIARITKMVDFVSSLGSYLGTVEGFEFYEFPSLERLAMVSEAELRQAGFGYRLCVVLFHLSFIDLLLVNINCCCKLGLIIDFNDVEGTIISLRGFMVCGGGFDCAYWI